MNDHELDAGLRAFHVQRTQLQDPPELHQRILALPLDDISQGRSWLPPLPSWRFQTMFSATKFVGAGLVVALFGGLLLAGVTTRQGEESGPVAGASASASSEIRSDLLPGVGLEVEQVGERLVRVLSDHQGRRLDQDITGVAVALNGDVWIQRPNGWVHGLGDSGRAFQDRNARFERGPDGTTWVGRRQLVGEDWVFMSRSDDDDARFCVGAARHLAPDETCWTAGRGLWVEGAGTSGLSFRDDSFEGYRGLGNQIDIAPDGTVWSTLFRELDASEGEGVSIGVASYDGSTWTAFESDVAASPGLPAQIAVAPDGVVWMSSWFAMNTHGPPPFLVMSWNGQTWTNHGTIVGSPDIDFLPDRTPWFGRVVELDGGALVPIEVLEPIGDGKQVSVLADGPDGSTWMVVHPRNAEERGGLYVITPGVSSDDE